MKIEPIDTQTWHARVFHWWATRLKDCRSSKGRDRIRRIEERPDLCHYFWIVVFFAPLRWFFFPAPSRNPDNYQDRDRMPPVFGVTVGTLALGLLGVYATFWWKHPANAAIFTGILLIGGAIILGAVLLGLWIQNHPRTEKTSAEKTPRPPSITAAYLRSKKSKVCPLITFKETSG